MLDRFNNPDAAPNHPWNQVYDYRQGGTFQGVIDQLDYLAELGVKALWLTPVLKNVCHDQDLQLKLDWKYTYPGYGAQDLMAIDGCFASDGAVATAEQEFEALVVQAHARGIYVVLDIVLNHTARVFDYWMHGQRIKDFGDWNVINAPWGAEPAIRWIDANGQARADWENHLPDAAHLTPDDAIWPVELQRTDFFRRRGNKMTDDPGDSFVRGDFGDMRQLVVEYRAVSPAMRQRYGQMPVLNILIHCYQYLIARYDIDGFRIDTVKYVDPTAVEIFGNAIREYATSIGKHNFFMFGEIADDMDTIAKFVGRNSPGDGYGIDAALDFPLADHLPWAAKGLREVEQLQRVYTLRKLYEQELLSTHGEAGRFFVTFLDNHDKKQRFFYPGMPQEQVVLGLGLLFTLQGIPCVYYGTEQGLQGTVHADGTPDLDASLENVREALWGRQHPPAFAQNTPLYLAMQTLARARDAEPALRYGRQYFRPVSTNLRDFGPSYGMQGMVAFSRILADQEVLIVANTNTHAAGPNFTGGVLIDYDINHARPSMHLVYSNQANAPGSRPIRTISSVNLYDDENRLTVLSNDSVALEVDVRPMEILIFATNPVLLEEIAEDIAEDAVRA